MHTVCLTYEHHQHSCHRLPIYDFPGYHLVLDLICCSPNMPLLVVMKHGNVWQHCGQELISSKGFKDGKIKRWRWEN